MRRWLFAFVNSLLAARRAVNARVGLSPSCADKSLRIKAANRTGMRRLYILGTHHRRHIPFNQSQET